MSDSVIALTVLSVLLLVMLHLTRYARLIVSAICVLAALIFLFALPGGGADNPILLLMALGCLAVVVAAAASEAIALIYHKLVKSAAHG